MYIIPFPGNMGKSVFSRVNSFSLLNDLIISNALFGSTNTLGRPVPTANNAPIVSNSQIPYDYLDYSCLWLNRHNPRDNYDYVLVNPQSDITTDPPNWTGAYSIPIHDNTRTYLRACLETGVINRRRVYYGGSLRWYNLIGATSFFHFKNDSYFYTFSTTTHAASLNFNDLGYLVYLYRSVRSNPLTSFQDRNWECVGVLAESSHINGRRYFSCALNHNYALEYEFIGLPYISVADGGPSAATAYVMTSNGQPNFARSSRQVLCFGRTTRGPNGDVHSYLPTQNRVENNILIRTGMLNLVESRSLEQSLSVLVLSRNRCFIDSIGSFALSGDGATLSGGVNADVIAELNASVNSDCIGLLGLMDPYTHYVNDNKISFKTKEDPFMALFSAAYAHGYTAMWTDNQSHLIRMEGTTRSTLNRDDLYLIADYQTVVGNYLTAKINVPVNEAVELQRQDVCVAQVNLTNTNKYDDTLLSRNYKNVVNNNTRNLHFWQ